MKPQSTLSIFIFLVALTSFGCDSVNVAEATSDPDFSEDAAASIAVQISEDPGGMLDQVNDVLVLTNLESTGKTESLERSYDAETQTWTAILDVERGESGSDQYATLHRVYQYQFQDQDGKPRKFYATARDTAHQIVVDIVDGSGMHKGPYHEHQLTALDGDWIVTGIDGDQVTVTGSYSRSAEDGLNYRSGGERELVNTLSLTFTELVAPRPVHIVYTSARLSEIISGELSGSYHADITWSQDGETTMRTIDMTFIVTFSEGKAMLTINGNTYDIDPASGSIIS